MFTFQILHSNVVPQIAASVIKQLRITKTQKKNYYHSSLLGKPSMNKLALSLGLVFAIHEYTFIIRKLFQIVDKRI